MAVAVAAAAAVVGVSTAGAQPLSVPPVSAPPLSSPPISAPPVTPPPAVTAPGITAPGLSSPGTSGPPPTSAPPLSAPPLSAPPLTAPPGPAPLTLEAARPPAPSPGLVVRDVTVRDLDGRVAWRGDVDLAPVLARIARGQRDPHRDDGTVFGNRERRLPPRPRGYYREYVVRTPGLRSVGPQRVVLGREGEVFYTADHYGTFVRVRAAGGR